MPKIVRGLAATQVKKSKPKSKEYNLADGNGLYLRVKPNGTKLWLFNYHKPFSKQRTNFSLGIYPDVDLSQARLRREDCRKLLANNIDPKADKDSFKSTQEQAYLNTFEVIARRWFETKRVKLTEAYADDLINSLINHVFPKMGATPVHLVTAPGTIQVLKPLATANKLEMIRRVCQRLNMVMDYAVNTGLVPNNPLSGINKAFITPEKVNFATLDPSELPMLMETMRDSTVGVIIKSLFAFQLHSMTRPGEAAGAKWSEINGDVWTIPASRMKKNREHKVPLTPQVLAILETMKPISGNLEYIFPTSFDMLICSEN